MKEAPVRLPTTLDLNSLPAHLEPPPERMPARRFRHALCAAIWAVLSLAGAGRALATLTVSPNTITNDYTGKIDLNITGLDSPGQTVVIEKYFDADGSNTINAGDILVAKYQVTDGQVTSIANHRNLNIPGDDDGAADGKILTKLHGDSQDTIGMLDGQFIFRVSPSGTGFTPFTASLVVTQKDYGGSGLSGTVSVSGTPQAGALVLISSTDSSNKGPVGFTHSDASGHFSIKVPPGAYQIWGVKHGFVFNKGAAPKVTVASGTFVIGQSVPLVASGRTISGTVSDSTAPHQPLPGVAVIGQSADGMLSITFADGSGNFTVDATAGQWGLETDSALITRLGFLRGKTSESSTGSVTGFSFALQRVTALIYGTVADSGANPLAGIQLNANDSNNNDVSAISDASGHYSLGVIAGSWYASISNSSPGLAGYVVPNGQSVTISDAQAVQAGFTLLAANAHLQGVVTNNGTPVPSIQISAYNQNTNQSVNGQTALDGTFDLGLAAGTWSLQIDSSSAASLNVVSPSINYTLSANQTLSGITFAVASVTGHIVGTVKDGLNNPVSGVQVYGNATVAGTNYSSSATTDSGGNYSVPAFAGTWDVGVSSYDLQAHGFLSPSNQNATVSTGTVTLNFIVLSPTSTIHGSVKTPAGTPLPSVPVSARQMGGGGVQINGQTDANGNYSLGVSTGSWDVGPEFTAGYVPQRENVIVNTDGSNVLQNLVDHPVTAHLRGQIRDNHNNPVGNQQILAVDNSFNNTNVSATTDANGNFDLLVYGGEGVGLTKQWTLQIPEGNVSVPSPYVSSVVSFQVQDSVDINNITYVVYLITAHLRGQVLDENNAPVPNIAVGASNQNIQANTGSGVDASGTFDIPIFGGTWGLGLSLIQGLGLIPQNEQVSVTDGVDQNNMVIRARHATATIAGSVKDAQNNPISGVQVFGNITVAGINYSTSTSTDGGGNYSLPVFSGTWDVGLSGNDLQSRGYQQPADQNAFANTGTVTLNFTVSNGTMATLAATNITGTGATLNGSVNPGGLSTTVSFDYGLTNSYGSNIAAVPSPISGSGPTAVSAVLTGLSSGTTYHYRVVATNSGGTNSGADVSFTAGNGSAVAPTITSQPVNQTVTAGQNATFTVAASGTPMPTIQWQVSTDGGANWSILANDSTYGGVGTPTLTVTATIIGQNSYLYRAVATNTAGPATSNNALLTVNVSGPPAVTHFTVGKWLDYLQSSASAPVPAITLSDPAGNFGFSAEISGSNLTSLSPAPGIALPGGATYPLAYQDGQWKFVATTHNFTSQSALDAAFPDGTYTMNIGSLASNVSMGLSPDSYPNTPAVVNGAWDVSGNLLVNAGADSTINFNTFANYANGGAVEFKVFTINSDGQGHTFLTQMVASAFNISVHGDPVLTSSTILSGTLQPNQVYYAEVSFDQLININTSAIPGAFGGADFARHTGFYISTVPPSGPMITQQPANQTVTVGQNATFTVAASGTPAPTLQWQVSTDGGANWSNLANDATSSGVDQATLTVTTNSSLNGYQYRCVATNTGGPATSNAATLTVNTPPPQFAAVQFFGGAGDQRGTGITIANGAIYVTGNAQPESQNNGDSALLVRYAIPFGGAPVWSRTFASGSLLYGVAASSTGIYGAGASYTLTTDAVGGKEDKTILAKFLPDGSSGTGPGGSAWVAGSGGTGGLSAFFAYGGVEMFRAAAVNTEAGVPVVYAAGFGQPASYSACLVAKFDAAGNRLAAATDSAAGLSLSRVSIPSTGGSSANGVAVLGSSIYVAGSTGWAIEGDAAGRPVVWIYNQSLGLTLRQRDTSLSGGFNAITAAGGALYAAGFVSTPGVAGSENYLVQRFSADGTRQWSATWGGQATDVLTGVVGVGGRLFVSGYTKSQGAGGFDGVLCEIDPGTGNLLSTVLIGGSQDDMANGLATDGTDLYVVGETRSFTNGANAAGQNDGFVVRYVLGATTPAPTVTTTAATSLTATGMTLNGTVNANGADTTVSFDYGLTTNYGSNIAATPSPVTGSGDTAVSAIVSGLLPSTTYHYRARGGSAGGAAQGADATFTTPSNVATLSKLVLSTGTLSPAFVSTITNYSASVSGSTTSIMVTSTVTQGQATVQVNGNTVASTVASGPISLSAGGTLITVVVTAQDGTTAQTYTIAAFAPLIAVQQPAGTGLIDGSASRDFGGVAPGKTGTLMFTVKNTGKAVLNGFGLTFDGANPGDFAVTTPPAASVAAGGSTTFAVTFTPGAPEVRTATLHLASNDLVHSPFDIALTGTGAVVPSITIPPASQMVGVGLPVLLTVTADGGASSYQWLKNNVPVPGATSSTYSPTAALTNAGAYTVKVTNAAGSVTSSPAANVGVVNVTPATVTVISGNTMTLTAAAAGPGLTYQWQWNGANSANSLGVISGTSAPTLTIPKTIPADANTYTCVVSMPDPQHSGTFLSLLSGAFTVNVTAKPVLNAFTPGPWIVSGTVTDAVTAQNNPTTFSVTGLPPGVTVNTKTGQLGGKPLVTIASATSYLLVVTATNAAGTTTLTPPVSVTVLPLQSNAIGTFNGLVDRDASLTSGYGGTINVTSLSTGTYTGKLTLGALSYSFTSQQLDATVGFSPSGTVVISRKLPLPSLIISFGIDKNTGELSGSVTDGVIATPVPLDAWRNPWNATSHPAPQAAVYNSGLTLDPALAGTGTTAGNIVYPQGTGFGTLTVTAAGVATWSGKMADGVVSTCGTTMGPNGEVPLHFMLYTNTGSARGWVQASGTDPGQLLDSMGTFDWMKSPQTTPTLNYKNRIPLHNLTVVGAKYIKPTALSPLVMGITGGPPGPNAQLLFSEGGLLALTYTGTPPVSLVAAANAADLTNHGAFLITGTATNNSVSLPNPNPATLFVTINPGTGAFSGGFILHGDADPTKAPPAVINRSATFSGLCITRSTGPPTLIKGVGYFLLPELQPYPGPSVTTSPLLSGQLLLQQDH